ncbi:MAG: hypothetical protein IAE86_06105 [Burkholderiaceae bacterium]|nr:hypothetical protein [Burkholderiaceae bacterium]
MQVQTCVAGSLIAGTRIGVALCAVLLAGCASIERSLSADASPAAAAAGATAAPTPAAAAPTAEVARAGSHEPPQPEVAQRVPIGPEPATAPTVSAPARVAPRDTVRPVASAREQAKAAPSPSPSPATRLAKDEAPAAAPAKPAATPTLDLKSLETRLKETKAIGVFTKLALKNQVDELLDQFRAYYQGRVKLTLPQLRRSYDLLVLKVLALLQDADPPLASAIASSRESIWGILSNPVKFAAV